MLCANTVKAINDHRGPNKAAALPEDLVAAHYYCLLDWLMASTTYPFDNQKLASTVFGAIEFGLLGQKLIVESVQGDAAKKKDADKKPKRMSVREPSSAITARSESPQMVELLDSLRAKPAHASEVIKEAATILLVQLCNFLQNFPCPAGIAVMSSMVQENDDVEEEESMPLFYIYNDFALFSLVEVPLEDGDSMARVIMRDCTGKYAWDARINYDHLNNGIEPPCSLLRPALPPPEFPKLQSKYVYRSLSRSLSRIRHLLTALHSIRSPGARCIENRVPRRSSSRVMARRCSINSSTSCSSTCDARALSLSLLCARVGC